MSNPSETHDDGDRVSLTCFEHPSFHPQEHLYMQFFVISFLHPYKQSSRW